MTTSTKLTVFVLLGVATVVGLSIMSNEPTSPPRVDTVFQQELVKSGARAETVRVVTTRQKLRVDSLLRTDTLTLTARESVFVRVVDTLVQQCTACAARLDSLRMACEASKRRDADSMAKLNARIRALEKQRTYAGAGGLTLGLLACR